MAAVDSNPIGGTTPEQDGPVQQHGLAPAVIDPGKLWVLCLVLVPLPAFLFWLSNRPWAGAMSLPHNLVLDHLYSVLDPSLLYLSTGLLSCYFLVSYQWSISRSPRLSSIPGRVALAIGVLMIVTTWLLLIETTAKAALHRARPVTRIEHSLIAARIDGVLPLATRRLLESDPDLFTCPFGRIVFGPLRTVQNPTWEQVRRFARSESDDIGLQYHLDAIRRRAGLGDVLFDSVDQIYTFEEAGNWLRGRHEPWFRGVLGVDKPGCDWTTSAPSGITLRQSLLAFLAVIILALPRRRGSRHHRRYYTALYTLNAVALLTAWWSPIYGFRSSFSDGFISLGIATTFAVLMAGSFAFAATTFSTTHKAAFLAGLETFTVLHNASTMITFFDTRGVCHLWNRGCVEVTGYNYGEVRTLGHYVRLLYPMTDTEVAVARLRRAMSEMPDERGQVGEILTKDGRKKLVLWNSTLVRDGLGKALGVLSVGVELSSLRRRLSDIGLVSAQMAHEIGHNLFRVVHEMMLLDSELGPTGVDALRPLRAAVEGTLTVANRYTGYVGREAESRADLDLAELARDSADIVRPLADELGVQIEVDVGDGIPHIKADPVLMRQALVELVKNAVTSCGRSSGAHEPRVSIGVQTSESWPQRVVIRVRDNGPGFPEKIRRRVNRDSTSMGGETTGGQGIGLLLVDMAVQEHGGTLAVEDSPDGGAIVELSLPVQTER